MKRHYFILSIIVTVSGLLFPTLFPGETVVSPGNDCFGISIEHYKGKNGWTPVILFSRHLELFCRMNAGGQVFEGSNDDPSNLQPVFTIDLKTGGIHVGERYFSFFIEEQNPVRTRIRPLDKNEPITLKINRQQNRAAFYIGGTRLPLRHTKAKFTEIANGLYELTFDGPWVFTYWELIYEQATGRIYSLYDRDTPLEFERGRTRMYGDISTAEREALIALYNSTNGDSWDDNSGWKTPPLHTDGFALPGTENTWYGVTCDSGNTTLETIDLRSNNLEGTIPSELENLTNLTILYLSNNNLSGSIPPELGNLANLERLWLGYNQLSGTIPPGLGNLSNISYLTLIRNRLTGSIPGELGNLSNLEVLALTGNRLSGNIPPELGNLSSLLNLFLGSNQLAGTIPPELVNLSSLKRLYLVGNDLTGSIPPWLGNLANLERIWCNNNRLSGTIPPGLGDLTNLKQLFLGYNRLTGSIPPELGNLSALEVLHIQSNRLTGRVPSTIGSLTNLNNNVCDARWNGLYTDDDSLRTFLNQKQTGGDWESTQTTAPEDVAAGAPGYDSIRLSWTPIVYTGDDGGYRVFYSTAPGGPYTYFDMTADKTVSQMDVNGLSVGTLYYFVVRTRTDSHFYNDNTVDSEYSAEVTATTLGSKSIITTRAVTNITLTTADSGGNVTDDGGAAVTARGVCWSTSANPTITDSHTTDGSGTGAFTSSITGLTPGTTYHVRAYATNSVGTAYGSDRSFTTETTTPTVTTAEVSNITLTSASGGGNVTNDGGSAVTDRGVCWSTSENPTTADSHTTDGSGTGTFTSSITGLSPGTTYHVRAYATNSEGTAYGSDRSFTTGTTRPTVTTAAVSNITPAAASGGGHVTENGGAPVTVRGVCWSTSANPNTADSHTTNGSGTGTFASSITGLTPGTTYHVRAYATNSVGTAYGSDLTFTTPGNPVISGRVTYSTNTGTAGLAGVTLTFSNSGGTTTSDSAGNYSRTVSYGWNGTVTPSKTGFTFAPAGRNYTNVTSNQADQNYTAAAIILAISGAVTDGSGTGIADVSLTFSNNGGAAVTDANGNYSQVVPFNWSGIVTPLKEGFTFAPTTRTYANVSVDLTGQDYIAAAVTPLISGRITNSSGAGIGGVTLTFANSSHTAVTNSNGYYYRTVSYNWSGTVTPTKEGFTFEPRHRDYTGVRVDRSGEDYTAEAVTPVISGRITDAGNKGIFEVTLTFSDGSGGVPAAATDANGYYVQAVPYGWSGAVTPAKTGFTIEPDLRTYDNVTAAQTGQNYIASAVTPLISGRITDSSGAGIFDVPLTFSNRGGVVTTDVNGSYLHAVPYGWSGTAAPAKTGYVFQPVSREYDDVVTSFPYQDYSADAVNPAISGRVTTCTGAGVPGVMLDFSSPAGSLTKSRSSGSTAITDANGNYRAAVSYGWSGAVVPRLTGFHFSPAYHTYSIVTSDLGGQDFTCTPDVALGLQVSREVERAWTIRRHYGKVTLTVDNTGAVPVVQYVIYRKTTGEEYRVITEFPASGQAEESFTYNDTFLEKNTTYTYKAEALAPGGEVIGASNEVTI